MKSDPPPSEPLPAELRIETISPEYPTPGMYLAFTVLAEGPYTDSYIIPARIYVDRDLNDDGTAFDDVLGELRFIYYGSGMMSCYLDPTIFTPDIYNFTILVEEVGSLFYGNDSILVEVLEAPSILINNPQPLSIFSNEPPEASVSFNAENINFTQYRMYNDEVNTDYNDWMGEIEQALWNKMGDGFVFLEFFMNDSYGNFANEFVKIFKDERAPSFYTINLFDYNNSASIQEPNYQVYFNIDECSLDKVWYAINNGDKYFLEAYDNWIYGDGIIYSRFSLILAINEWDSLPIGLINITIHANDTWGRESSILWIIEKSEPPNTTPNTTNHDSYSTIPGLSLPIITLNSILVIFIVIRKVKLNLNRNKNK